MTESNLSEINGFHSMGEFVRFESWLLEQIQDNACHEIEVQDYFANTQFGEKWFKFTEVDEVWRLVNPEPPFRGYWGRVQSESPHGGLEE